MSNQGNTPEQSRAISVFGSSKTRGTDSLYQDAFAVGALLGAQGIKVLNGGYSGIMQAVSKGAKANGGNVIGVTCEIFKHAKANPYLTKEVQTKKLYTRLEKLINHSNGYIIFPGGTGTIAEFALTIEVLSKWKSKKPMIFWSEYWKNIIDDITRLCIMGDERIDPYKEESEGNEIPIHFVHNIQEFKEVLNQYFPQGAEI